MKYEMINEELRIARCSLADLTLEQVKHFLGQWEPGSNIGNLILFYEKEDDVIVLNSSNKKYQVWLDIVEAYLIATGENRKKLQEMLFEYSKDAGEVLNNCIRCRAYKEKNFQARKNITDNAQRDYINYIFSKYDPYAAVCIAYRAGVIYGKRAERKKRRAV